MPASSWCETKASAWRGPGWRGWLLVPHRNRAARKRSSRSQSRRASADLRTTNRPDARLGKLASKKKSEQSNTTLFQSPKRPSEYQGYRAIMSDRAGNAMPILIGAVIIASAILLSTLITAVGTRFVGMESPNEETVWLIDRLTGNG